LRLHCLHCLHCLHGADGNGSLIPPRFGGTGPSDQERREGAEVQLHCGAEPCARPAAASPARMMRRASSPVGRASCLPSTCASRNPECSSTSTGSTRLGASRATATGRASARLPATWRSPRRPSSWSTFRSLLRRCRMWPCATAAPSAAALHWPTPRQSCRLVRWALGATVVVQNVRARRAIAPVDYFRGLYETARAPDELLVEVQIPVQSRSCVSVFIELAPRHGDFRDRWGCVPA
jgi:hypothetical protein